MSTLTKKQAIGRSVNFTDEGTDYILKVTVRHDDECGNGHNTFAITGNLYRDKKNGYKTLESCGCMHDDIAKHFPDLAPLIKWHLTSTDGPMHYVANTVYHAKTISKHQQQQFVYIGNKQLGIKPTLLGIYDDAEVAAIKSKYPPTDITTKEHFNDMAKESDIDAARRSAIWPDATLAQLLDETALKARLPALMAEFRRDVESLGLVY